MSHIMHRSCASVVDKTVASHIHLVVVNGHAKTEV